VLLVTVRRASRVSWTNTNTSGVALASDGGMTTIARCSTPRPIACCL
jgi:hypothetical protein